MSRSPVKEQILEVATRLMAVRGYHRTALDDVLREAAAIASAPALAGIPLGHIDDQWTIPLGAMAQLDADACTLHVALA